MAWGLAAGAAISSGLVAAEAGAYSAVGWTAVGLIGGPTTLGLAIANYVDVANDPSADSTDRAFAKFNLAISAFVFVGVHAEAIAAVGGESVAWQAGPELTNKINEIRALPANTQLTADQLAALRENVELLKGSITENPGNTRVADRVRWLIQNDSRFTNLSDAQRQAFSTQIEQTIKATGN